MLFEQLRSFFKQRGFKTEENLWGFDVPEISIGVNTGFTDSFPEQDIQAFYAGRRGVLAST